MLFDWFVFLLSLNVKIMNILLKLSFNAIIYFQFKTSSFYCIKFYNSKEISIFSLVLCNLLLFRYLFDMC